MNKEIAILIPCLNEELSIGKVIKDFKYQLPNAIIYVYDNNSTDNTFKVAKENGAIVRIQKKPGKGNTILKMFEDIDADIYIMVDGDDTYPAQAIHPMIMRFQNDGLDMLVGDRLSNESYKKENKRRFHNFGNSLIRKLINTFFQSHLDDILSGYRIFNKKFVKNYSGIIKGFELETDLSIFALNYNLNIGEFPIIYKDRMEGSRSKLNTFSDGFKVIKLFLNLYRLYKPLKFFGFISILFFLIGIVMLTIPLSEYIDYHYVYKVPTLIFSLFLISLSILSFFCGLILDNIAIYDKKNFLVKYRNYEN